MPHYLAAHFMAFLTSAAARRDERGQTTAEYIGIMVVIVAIIGTILALKTNVLTGAQSVVDKVFTTLTDKVE
jgi:Flp pilus assembly pilin Flp